MFFLVSGAAASGKSTVARNISSRLENIECHDFDEKQPADTYTRCQQLEEWVKRALEIQQDGQDFLLASHSPLGELLACPSAPQLVGISACLLDCSDIVRITRMWERGIDPRWPPSQEVLSWASWHRMHAWDPQWEPQFSEGNVPASHSYARWTNWEQKDARWHVTVIDSTKLDVEQTLDMITNWVKTEREQTPHLSPDTRWWK